MRLSSNNFRNTRLIRLVIVAGAVVFLGASCQQVSDGGVFKSEDEGETWQQKVFVGVQKKSVISISDVNVEGLFLDPTNPDVMYLATKESGIHKTETAGEQWRKLNLAVGRIRDIAIAPDNPNILYAAHQQTILKSLDGGEQWHVVYADAQSAIINSIEIDHFQSHRIFAATSIGVVLMSEDFGTTWAVVFETPEPLTELFISPHDSGLLYLLELDRNIYKSSDGGTTFAMIFTPELQKALAEKFEISGIAPKQFSVDPTNDQHMVITDSHGLFQSTNGGSTWEYVKTLVEKRAPQNAEIRNLTIVPGKSNTILFTLNNQIHKTSDGGLTWRTITTFPSSRRITSVVAHPTLSNILYAGVEQVEKRRRGLIGQ